MKKAIALLTIIALGIPAMATEPLILEPLSPIILSTVPNVTTTEPAQNVEATTKDDANSVQVSFPTGHYAGQFDANMVPQNAAAEGKPVPARRTPKVRVQTKQRSQGNSYWNAGGKGTKSFF